MTRMLKIDLNMWQTPTERAKEKGYSTQYISTLIRQGKIKFWKIEELNIVLVAKDKPQAAKVKPVVKDLNKPTNQVKPITEPKPKSNYSVNTDYLNTRRKSKLGLK